jgi:hypothetical protein
VAVLGAAAALSAATVAPLAAPGSPEFAKLTAAVALLAGLASGERSSIVGASSSSSWAVARTPSRSLRSLA